MRWFLFGLMLTAGCSSADANGQDAGGDVVTTNDAAGGNDAIADSGPISDAGTNPLGLSCSATKQSITPSACPAPSGASGQVSFCFRAQWPGVTSVDVIGGFGQSGDWSTPFVSLKNDGTGTFTGTASLPNGSYPYLFRATGSADGIFKTSAVLLDQEATQFEPPPPASPLQRSVPVVTVPQSPSAPTLHHLRGVVVYEGAPQPCFPLQIDVGELYKDGGSLVLSEQGPANYAQSAADGTFDFPVASAQVEAIVRYPFTLGGFDAGYPDPSTSATIGYARTSTKALDVGDVTLDPVELSYPKADYAAMSPTSGKGVLPETFQFTVVPGSTGVSVAVISTNIAGNDPAFWGPSSMATSYTWDGAFGGNGGNVVAGKTYYWGTWQKRGIWSEESLLFPIVF